MGSSYFRLLVAEIDFGREGTGGHIANSPAGIDIIYEQRLYVGWGEDISGEHKSISAPSLDNAIKTLEVLLHNSQRHGCPQPRLVSTNTLREAGNAEYVVSSIRNKLGRKVHILHSRSEAELGYAGAVSGLAGKSHSNCMVFDPGGTSTEISLGGVSGMDWYTSIPLGTHRVRRMISHFSSPGHIRYSRQATGERLARSAGMERVRREYSHLSRKGKEVKILITGGTAVSLALIAEWLRNGRAVFEELAVMGRSEIELILRRLGGKREVELIRFLPLESNRARLIIPGMVLMQTLLEVVGAQSFMVTARDLRWGVVLPGNKGWKESYEG